MKFPSWEAIMLSPVVAAVVLFMILPALVGWPYSLGPQYESGSESFHFAVFPQSQQTVNVYLPPSHTAVTTWNSTVPVTLTFADTSWAPGTLEIVSGTAGLWSWGQTRGTGSTLTITVNSGETGWVNLTETWGA